MAAHEIVKTRRVYQVLGLPDFASADEAKRAYREKALLLHPDKNQSDPEAAEKFKTVNAAYQVLSDTARKADYDALLAAARAAEARMARVDAMMSDPNKATGFARSATHYAEELHTYRESRRTHSSAAGPRAGAGAAAAAAGSTSPRAGSTPAGAKNRYTQGGAAGRPHASPQAADSADAAGADSTNESAAPHDASSPTGGEAPTSSSTYSAAQQELFRKREKEREREVVRRMEREREEKREKEIERMKRMQAQKQTEEERRRREQEKLREKISKVFNPSPVFASAAVGGTNSASVSASASGASNAAGSPVMNATTAATLAADIRAKAAASAAAAKAARSSSGAEAPAAPASGPTTPSSHQPQPHVGRSTSFVRPAMAGTPTPTAVTAAASTGGAEAAGGRTAPGSPRDYIPKAQDELAEASGLADNGLGRAAAAMSASGASFADDATLAADGSANASPAASNVSGSSKQQQQQQRPTPTRAELLRDDRIRQQELRQRAHEQQIEARLAQLRAAEDRRLEEEQAERKQMYARRRAEVEADEDQERRHYIEMQEVHARGVMAQQLRRIEVAYRNLCQQTALQQIERDQRRAFDFAYLVWTYEAWLWKREGAARHGIAAQERSDAAAARHDFSIGWQRLSAECAQRVAVDTESDGDYRRLRTHELVTWQRMHLQQQAEQTRLQHVAAIEAADRAHIARRYWDHKVSVVLERDEVARRRAIASDMSLTHERLRVEEAASRHRASIADREIADFEGIMATKAADWSDFLRSIDYSLKATQALLTESRLNEARLRNDMAEAAEAAAKRASEARAEVAALKDEHADELRAVHATIAELRRQLDRAAAADRHRDEAARRREEELQRRVADAEADTVAHREKLRARVAECASLGQQVESLRAKVADLEDSVALGRTPPPTAHRSGAASSVPPSPGSLSGASSSREAVGPAARSAATTADGPGAKALKAIIDSQSTTIATLKRRVVALEALVDERRERAEDAAEVGAASPLLLRGGGAAFQSGGGATAATSNKELVALLCAENKRLLDANAALLDENRALALQQSRARTNGAVFTADEALDDSLDSVGASGGGSAKPSNGASLTAAAAFRRLSSSTDRAGRATDADDRHAADENVHHQLPSPSAKGGVTRIETPRGAYSSAAPYYRRASSSSAPSSANAPPGSDATSLPAVGHTQQPPQTSDLSAPTPTPHRGTYHTSHHVSAGWQGSTHTPTADSRRAQHAVGGGPHHRTPEPTISGGEHAGGPSSYHQHTHQRRYY